MFLFHEFDLNPWSAVYNVEDNRMDDSYDDSIQTFRNGSRSLATVLAYATRGL